jgi:hypothetical protein
MADKLSRLHFRSLDGTDTTPQEWLRLWADRYPSDKYDAEHDALIAKRESLSPADFERIGRWKDAAKTDAKWKPNVASVAYDIWMQAASELPRCPDESRVVDFLRDWSERKYTNKFTSRTVEKRFGLSRATTLLYFVSGGRFPIFDSRVRRAIRRLCNVAAPDTVSCYMDLYRPAFLEVAGQCGTQDLRRVDQALFSYGDKTLSFSD